jgi:hypothetical protein
MKIQAIWKKKGLNPFKPEFDRRDFYKKVVEVEDCISMESLKRFAIADTLDGYEFLRIEKVPDCTPVSPYDLDQTDMTRELTPQN